MGVVEDPAHVEKPVEEKMHAEKTEEDQDPAENIVQQDSESKTIDLENVVKQGNINKPILMVRVENVLHQPFKNTPEVKVNIFFCCSRFDIHWKSYLYQILIFNFCSNVNFH